MAALELTDEEQMWLQQQIDNEENGEGGVVLTDDMEDEMLHFLNATGQEADGALGSLQNSEKRFDSDGALYTKEDFIKYYSTTDQWNEAPVEKKFDSDNKPYSYSEFVAFYGEVDANRVWEVARKQEICTKFQQGQCEFADRCIYVHLPPPRSAVK
eukprot:TRINITY_DN3908_c0_g1_i1.p1 TRINITY_DN3908_c0_g1~~TRINITY_DN3908_c0_g1_i1.p1  ORF type:complete len:181 (+),score=35.89 TRINITY_DN3908_c0_g1_i1:77-544(+)